MADRACADCGAPLSEGETATFTVCDACWDKDPAPAPSPDWVQEVRDRYEACLGGTPDAKNYALGFLPRALDEIERLRGEVEANRAGWADAASTKGQEVQRLMVEADTLRARVRELEAERDALKERAPDTDMSDGQVRSLLARTMESVRACERNEDGDGLCACARVVGSHITAWLRMAQAHKARLHTMTTERDDLSRAVTYATAALAAADALAEAVTTIEHDGTHAWPCEVCRALSAYLEARR